MTVAVWVLVAASAVAWGLRFKPSPLPVRALAQPLQIEDAQAAGSAEWQRMLGANKPVDNLGLPEASARFKLLGVIADYAGHGRGVALIAVDDKPAHSFRVGTQVDGDLLLQSVRARSASLGGRQGASVVTLELPNPASLPVRSSTVVAPVPGAAMPAPALATSAPVAPTPVLAEVPPARMAAPGEMVSPGRRQRLWGRSSGQAPEAP